MRCASCKTAFAQSGAQAEICPPDERPALFVLIDNTPRGPVPRAWVEQCLARGVWVEDAILVAETGSTTWMPYWKLDTALSMSPLQPPAPPPPLSGNVLTATSTARAAPVSTPGLVADGVLPAGKAIHAGLWRRNAAYVLDMLIISIPISIISIVPTLGALIAFIGQWLYFALMESSGWQAMIGKRAMGIKVVDQQGQRIGFGRATGRYFGQIVSFLMLYIGFLMIGWTERKQALHDKMAGTCVVFDAVQPGQPLPAQRPSMPWYGWVVNCVVPTLFILGMLAAIALPAYWSHSIRSRVSTALAALVPATPKEDVLMDLPAYNDDVQWAQWYRKAVEQGDARAQLGLGLCYDLGQGVAQDDEQAVQWYRKAAEQGHAEAQRSLDELKSKGK